VHSGTAPSADDRYAFTVNVYSMTNPASGGSTTTRIVAALRELIGALDRRVPHVERSGEIRIARDAAMLRRDAVLRIEAVKHAATDHPVYDQDLVEAIMTDDGGLSPGSPDCSSR
jgi:predicted O-linked N-acetylglucosamine transferase (SPINDLY family)